MLSCFTELSSLEYIVSRRIYELFKKYGVKKMNFEPVFALETNKDTKINH